VPPLSGHCSKRASDIRRVFSKSSESDVHDMNVLPDYGDYVSCDIRWSIHEETVQIGVYLGTMLTEAYEIEIENIPTECKAWINLLERL